MTLSAAYVLIIKAMRHGEVAVVAPFRYAFLIWAIIIQIAIFSRLAGCALTLLGSAILVATGLYTLYRERSVADGQSTATAHRRSAPDLAHANRQAVNECL